MCRRHQAVASIASFSIAVCDTILQKKTKQKKTWVWIKYILVYQIMYNHDKQVTHITLTYLSQHT